ncbi:DUF624 domain-containing protein [Microbacterium lacus]|uniref:ferredoxin-NADPH reductase n=1 Tax=Microbacterium lacus TaxID=415217 RepID=UPI00384AB68C
MYATVFNVVYLGVITNALLIASCLPMVVLLVTTDPMHSWPLLALAAPLCAPGIAAAFRVFREQAAGGNTPARAFWAGLKATWRKALAIGVTATAVMVVVLVDLRMVAEATIGMLVGPMLLVVGLVTLATTLLALVALAEEPGARLRDIVKAAAVLSTRRWYLTAVSLLALAAQVWLFVSMPAIALGITASAALYLAWANSRYSLRPVLDLEPAVA